MEDLSHVLAIPENRVAVQAICQRILTEIGPEHLEVSAAFIEPLIDMVAEGQTLTFDDSDKAGGMGGSDLLVTFAVSLVVEIIAHLLIKLGKKSIKEFKKSLGRESSPQNLIKIAIDETEATITIRVSPDRRKKIKKLVKAAKKTLNAAIIEYLEADE